MDDGGIPSTTGAPDFIVLGERSCVLGGSKVDVHEKNARCDFPQLRGVPGEWDGVTGITSLVASFTQTLALGRKADRTEYAALEARPETKRPRKETPKAVRRWYP